MRISDWSSDVCSSDLFPAGSESAACRGQDCEAGAIRTRRIHRYHHGTRPQMKRACLSENGTPVARQVTQGREAQGWNEIGRPTSRERVCQDVEIVVDAV